jgi:translation initiation factor IF-2
MASMRVHELAKELNMSSKELLDRLAEMKIPAKSHASVLNDAYVQKIRKNLAPEEKAQAGIIDDEEAKKLAEEKAAEKAQREKEEAERRAAVEKERKLREEERARRQQHTSGKGAYKGGEEKPQAPQPASPYASLEEQIRQEKERVAREAAEKRQRARLAAIEREVAKKKAVEERLHGSHKKSASAAPRGPQAGRQGAARAQEPVRFASGPDLQRAGPPAEGKGRCRHRPPRPQVGQEGPSRGPQLRARRARIGAERPGRGPLCQDGAER